MSGIGRFSLPLARPLETAVGTIERREGFLVRLGDDPVGIGEATPLPGWTETVEDCRTALEEAIESAAELRDPDDLPELAATPAARHALELAVLDRQARTDAVPLYRYLGGPRRVSTLPVNATIGDADVETTVGAARDAVRQGFRTIKVKVGARPVDEDVERLAAVREAVGGRVELRADANGAWTPAQAATAIEKLGWIGVTLVEQPVDPTDLAAAADLRRQGSEIALDEALTVHAVDEVIEAGAADWLVLKPMVLGGVGRAADIAAQARNAGIGVYVTTTIDAAVARTAAVHLAAALDVEQACGLATAAWLDGDVGEDPAAVVDGGISVPQGAGHGVGVEELE